MSTTSNIRLVRIGAGTPDVGGQTCIDLTTPTARKGKLLIVESLKVVYVPLEVARDATPAAYDAANLVSLLQRVTGQLDASKAAYARKTVQQVSNHLVAVAKGIATDDVRHRSGRRLYAA
jgi:hypothetical protein